MKIVQNVKLIFSVFIVAVFILYFVLNAKSFEPVLHVNPIYLLFISICSILGIVSNGIFTKIVLKSFDRDISTRESIFVSLIAAVGNFFAPAGSGLGFRAVYLKKKHKLPYSDYVTILSGNYVMVFIIVSLMGIVALALLGGGVGREESVAKATLWLVFTLLFLLSTPLLFIRKQNTIKTIKTNNSIMQKIIVIAGRISNGWIKITSDRSLVVKLLVLIVINTSVSTISLALIMIALQFSFTVPALFLFSALGSLTTFINITPANLGVKEAVYIASSSVLGFTTGQILSIALVDRATQFFVLAVAWLIFGKSNNKIASKDL
ncbi:MAG: flippase-like domain-containing protein [Candidatus Nomurabacteria bacterium]|nr:MAG: flippase-like domain-containing protein [Candidatus Nomurabacteria bacterium]